MQQSGLDILYVWAGKAENLQFIMVLQVKFDVLNNPSITEVWFYRSTIFYLKPVGHIFWNLEFFRNMVSIHSMTYFLQGQGGTP